MSSIYAVVAGNDPRRLEFDVGPWTRDVARQVIARDFGMSLPVVSVGACRSGGAVGAAPPVAGWQLTRAVAR